MKEHLADTEMVPQPHGGLLRRGNPGNIGSPGRPSARIRRKAKNLYDDTIDAMKVLLDAHNEAVKKNDRSIGSGRLSVSDLKAIAQETKGIGLGDLKEVKVEDESFFMAIEELLSELVDEGELKPHQGVMIHERFLQKVGDQ